MRILIVGTGNIGQHLASYYNAQGHEVTIAGRDRLRCTVHLDLSSAMIAELTELPFVDLAIMAAGRTGFAAVGSDSVQSEQINVANTIRLLDKLCRRNPTIFLSTSAVFDGTVAFPDEDAAPNPDSVYAGQKLVVEHYLQSTFPSSALIVRLTKVMRLDVGLLAGWHSNLMAGSPVYPFSDFLLAPISPDYLAESLLLLAHASARGVYHLSGERDISYGMLCGRLCAEWGCDSQLVVPHEGAGEACGVAYRPRFAAIGMTRSGRLGLTPCTIAQVMRPSHVPRLNLHRS